MKMKVLYFDKELRLTDISVPVRRQGEALIRVIYAGICQTDIEITKGYMDFKGVPGHEFVGVVEEADTSSIIGKRVVGEINIGCGECNLCLQGDPRHCTGRTVLGIAEKNGTFSEFITLPEKNLLVVPDSVSDEEAVFTELLAAAMEITDQIKISPNDNVAVIGDGRLGLLIAQVIKHLGSQIIMYGISERKLSLAKSFGIPVTINNGKSSEHHTIVIECSGLKDGLYSAVDLVKPGGTIILKSTYSEKPEVDISRIVVDEIKLVGSRCGRFEPALRMLESKIIDVTSLIDRVFKLTEGIEAFHYIEKEAPLKVLLKID